MELQNFFLICQKESAKSLRLEILCESEDEIFRVRHYLYICRELAKEIRINGIPYKEASFAHFFKILPLTCINKNNFHFLSMKICDIEEKLGINIGANLLKPLEKEIKNRENPIEFEEPAGVVLPLNKYSVNL